jgi:hypothetical protein
MESMAVSTRSSTSFSMKPAAKSSTHSGVWNVSAKKKAKTAVPVAPMTPRMIRCRLRDGLIGSRLGFFP